MKPIIEMAREAGLEEMWELTPRFVEKLEAFAALVAAAATEAANARANTSWALMCKKMVAAEKEACAKQLDALGCAECGVNGNHALYCIACTEQFLLSEAIKHEREECASLNIPITTPQRDYLDMSPLEIYEEALIEPTLSFRVAIRARGKA